MKQDDVRISIKRHLEDRDISLSAFAQQVGIEQPSLWRFLNGKSGLSGENILKLLPYCFMQSTQKPQDDGEK